MLCSLAGRGPPVSLLNGFSVGGGVDGVDVFRTLIFAFGVGSAVSEAPSPESFGVEDPLTVPGPAFGVEEPEPEPASF